MDVKFKFFRNNITTLIFWLDLFYVLIFFIFYLFSLNLPLNLNSVVDSLLDKPALFLILVHPFVLVVVLFLNFRQNQNYIKQLTEKIEFQTTKIEQVNEFIDQLRQGATNLRFNEEYQKDRLIRSLLNLRDELEKTRKEEEIRKKEEQQRHWTNEGLAKFGAILRENVDDLYKLTSEITSNLTKYVNSQQAGFFIVKEENGERVIEMISLFAFDRKKFPDKKFNWGEGLIGACAIEQKTIFLKETTDSYLDITSGLGKANPRSILIIPIKDNENVIHGVLELASFKVFEPFEVSFVEQVADSIGLTMATIKTSLRTQELLRESQKQTELLAQQEEVMRKNVEEILNQSNEFEQKYLNIDKTYKTIDTAVFHIDLNVSGKIIFVNERLVKSLKYESEDIILGQDFNFLIPQSDHDWFVSIWQEMLETKQNKVIELRINDAQNKFQWMNAALIPQFDSKSQIEKISVLALIEDEKPQIILERQLISALNNFSLTADLDLDAKFTFISENLVKKLQIELQDYDKYSFFDFVMEDETEQYKTIWANIIKGRKYRAVRKIVDKNKSAFVLDLMFTPIYDLNNIISKVSLIAMDVSESQSLKNENETLKSNLEKSETKLNELTNNLAKQVEKTKTDLKQEYETKLSSLDVMEKFLGNISDAVVIAESDYFVMVNKKAEELWGYKKEIVIGKKIKYLFPEVDKYKDDPKYLLNNISTNLNNVEMFILDKEMNVKNVLVTIYRYSDEAKNYQAFVLKQI